MEWIKQYVDLERYGVENLLFVGYEIAILIILYYTLATAISILIKKSDKIKALSSYHTKILKAATFIKTTLRVVLFLALLAILGFNGYLIYSGEDNKTYTLDLVKTAINSGFFTDLGLNLLKIIALIIVAKLVIKYAILVLNSLELKSKEYKQIEGNNSSIAVVFKRFRSITRVSIWLVILYIAADLFKLNETVGDWILITLKIFLIASIGLLVVNLITVIVKSLDELSRKYAKAKGVLGFYNNLQHLVPIFRKSLEYIIYAVSATLILKQLSFLSWLAQYGAGVVQAIGLIFIARVVVEVVHLFIDQTYLNDKIETEELNRNKTIYPIFKSMISVGIYFVVVVFIMKGFGFDPIPLLAGAGILGMVIGLGAQSLINDLVSGFFIILDGTYGVGDYIEINDAAGYVESINLRTTRIRSEDGKVFILRNGEINDVTNYSNRFTHALVDVGVDSSSNMDRVYSVLEEIAKEYALVQQDVVEQTKTLGVEDFSSVEVIIRTLTKVKPGTHLQVQRELKKLILERFAKEGIEIPFEKREA